MVHSDWTSEMQPASNVRDSTNDYYTDDENFRTSYSTHSITELACSANEQDSLAGADPGFPVGGGANFRGVGDANIQFCQNFRKTA